MEILTALVSLERALLAKDTPPPLPESRHVYEGFSSWTRKRQRPHALSGAAGLSGPGHASTGSPAWRRGADAGADRFAGYDIAFHIIKALEQEISNLSARREQLEAQNASLWNSFKGLEPYQAEGKSYLLTPAGQQIVNAGKVGQRDAWEVVRR